MTHSIRLIAAILLTGVLSNHSHAQEMYAGISVNRTQPDVTLPLKGGKNAKTTDVISPVVVAKFSTLFPNATSPKWGTSATDIWISFVNNGRKSNACFTATGKMNYVITDCSIGQLPTAFRKAITEEYASYNLFHAIEINAKHNVIYQAIIENAKGFIKLIYSESGVETIQQVNKSL